MTMTSQETLTETRPLHVAGHGLITGRPVTVEIERAQAGHGIVFYVQGDVPIPARLQAVVHTDRGVTLAHSSGATLSIVEHFLCGCTLAGFSDLKVRVNGAPELPLLDGSALIWLSLLEEHFGVQPVVQSDLTLHGAVFHRQNDATSIVALPSDRLEVTYAMNFDHPDLNRQFIRWDSAEENALHNVACARTFGFARELPALQAAGMALGVTPENTLGLTDEGGYTDVLRIEAEPLRHKVLDLLGDLTLTGLNPLRLKARIYAINAGHGAHTAFAVKLLRVLS